MDREKALADQVLGELSAKYDKSPSQLMLRWAMQRGCAVIPGTGNPGKSSFSSPKDDDNLANITNNSSDNNNLLLLRHATLDHMKENLSVYGFELSDGDMNTINSLKTSAKGYNPEVMHTFA